MIRVGAVNIDSSHPMAFAEYFEKGARARYTAVYNDGFRGDEEVNAFIKRFNLEGRCGGIDELAERVDIGLVHSCNWGRHIQDALPFIRRGKPVFVDKPLVGSLSHCKAIEELEQKGAVILGSSSVRYAVEIMDFLKRPEEERGKIVNIFGTAGVDEFNYGIHIVEAICTLAGAGAVFTRFAGHTVVDGKTCETYFVGFENGVTAVYNTFTGVWQPFELVVMTTRSTYQFRVDSSKVYCPLLDMICDYMETGKNAFATVRQLTDSIRVMLAGRLSKQQNCAEVKLRHIPEDDPGYDGDRFEHDYAIAATKIYL